ITIERSMTPGECACAGIISDFTCTDRSVMIFASQKSLGCAVGCAGMMCRLARRILQRAWKSAGLSHIMVGRILLGIADIKNDGLLSEILPTLRGGIDFGTDFAGFMRDRDFAVAGIFDYLALLHENQR